MPLLVLLVLLLVGCMPVGAPLPDPSPAVCHYQGQLPDPVCTPGAIDPAVTQNNLDTTICHPGYSTAKRATVPSSYFANLKREQMRQYAALDLPANYEEDHLISIELGGAVQDPRNLFPEPIVSARVKDKTENYLHMLVCTNRLPLADAQHLIRTDWTQVQVP